MSVMHHLLTDADLATAITQVGYRAVATTDRTYRPAPGYVLATPIRVELTDRPGAGVLTAVTADGWLELQLDGEARRDEWQQAQVRLAAPTVEAVCAAHGFQLAG